MKAWQRRVRGCGGRGTGTGQWGQMQKRLCGKAVSHTQLTLLCKEKTEHFSQYHPKNKTELKEVVGVVGGLPCLSEAELCNTPMWDLRQPNAIKKSMEKG